MRILAIVALLGVVVGGRAGAAPPCGGDCDGGGDVTVDELVKAVGIALGSASLDQCRNADSNHDGDGTVDEIVGAVNSALTGCPTFAGEYSGGFNLDGGRSADVDFEVQPNGQASGTVLISTPGGGALFGLGGGAGGISVSVSGSVDLNSG